MIRVLFHLSQFNIGGGEMSTLRLLNALQACGAQITLTLTEGRGALVDRLNSEIEVIVLRPGKRSENPAWRMLRGVAGVFAALPLASRRFDAAVVGMTGAPTWIVRHVVRAPRKLQFIRNDLSQMGKSAEIISAVRRNRHAFTAFVCVSDVARRSLIAAVPEVAEKAHVVHNILNPDEMRARALAGPDPFPPRRDGALRIASVCRLNDKAKALVRMVRVARRLMEAGLDFDWFVFGDGPDSALMEAEIAAQGVSAQMHLPGRIENPFPAFRHADLVAMLSYYEGLCGVINEAKVMGRPIVATRVSGVEEQLIAGETGLIAEQDDDAIVATMQSALTDTALRARMTNVRLPAALLDDDAKLDRLWQLFAGPGHDRNPSCSGSPREGDNK
ncbi:glycosyltransferase [Roseicyclus sp. F158]|uniref:Glycosyltransferase n=1 Tax=Tropicimonas omnivorans TaxID=3075590 RepID=A0ABU3DLD3_9RHOB|nr:glycosyltransferase [Roseicyclus sp. F158]MDT0684532.1 glycosyltransferase [Roseicyclus sp. F158]